MEGELGGVMVGGTLAAEGVLITSGAGGWRVWFCGGDAGGVMHAHLIGRGETKNAAIKAAIAELEMLLRRLHRQFVPEPRLAPGKILRCKCGHFKINHEGGSGSCTVAPCECVVFEAFDDGRTDDGGGR